VLKLLKSVTKRLKERSKDTNSRVKGSCYSAITKVILVFKYILTYYKQRVKAYKSINYNAHNKAPKDYLLINLCAA
jgi:hypothetical protein